MAITLPLPVRLAAGILGAGIDLLRALPDEIPAIPVTIVGNAMRLSLKIQQEIASLATRGDELLSGVVGAPQESPTWAKFDDDDEPAKPAKPATPIRPAGRTRPATGSGSTSTPAPGGSPDQEPGRSPVTEAHDPAASTPAPAETAPKHAADDDPALITPETTAMPPVTTTAMDAAIEVPQSVIDSATVAAPDALEPDVLEPDVIEPDAFEPDTVLADAVVSDADLLVTDPTDAELTDPGLTDTDPTDSDPTDTDPTDSDPTDSDPTNDELLAPLVIDVALESPEQLDSDKDDSDEEFSITLPSELADDPNQPVIIGETEELTSGLPIPEDLMDEVEAAVDGPAVLPDYDRMTLAQVRGHLRELSSADVSELLRYEQDGDNRAPFLTLLSNRLVTLDAQHS